MDDNLRCDITSEKKSDEMARDKRGIRKIQLAQKIIQLANQLGWKKGRHLTELELCEVLEVSRSPVRSALALLEIWGAVVKRPNQGYFLEQDADALLAVGGDTPPMPEDELCLAIVEARVSGRLTETFTQVELMAEFNFPRNLMEKALWRLSKEGLVERLQGRGWRFLPSFDETLSWEKGYAFRSIIEPAAILLPGFEIDSEKLTACRLAHQDLIAAVKSGSEVAAWIYEIDSHFHELVASFSKNGFFVQAIQNQNRLRRLMEYRGYSNRRRIIDWCNEHLAIIDALERSRFAKASELMKGHLDNASRVVPTSRESEPMAS